LVIALTSGSVDIAAINLNASFLTIEVSPTSSRKDLSHGDDFSSMGVRHEQEIKHRNTDAFIADVSSSK
jgi:hypothetical protein